jgi:DNA repair protein RecN (Recombination protein N)
MLRTLTIQDFVTVDRLTLDLQAGFSALTGETGAGKSILFDALGLLLGDRAEASAIRGGASKAEISAEFELTPEAHQALADLADELGLSIDEPLILLKRSLEANGRSRAWINGQPASVSQLKALGEHLVSVHGQHAHHDLLRTGAQRALLDRQAGLEPLVAEMSATYREWSACRTALERAQAEADQQRQQREELQWKLDLLLAASPQAGEWEALEQEQKALSAGAELISVTQESLAQLSEADDPMLTQISRLCGRLEGLTEADPRLEPVASGIRSGLIELEEATALLQRYVDRLEIDPERLSAVESRLSELHGLSRRLKHPPEDLPALQASLSEAIHALDQANDIRALSRALGEAEQRARAVGAALSEKRRTAASALSAAVNQWLAELSMKGSDFHVSLLPKEQPSASGFEEVLFLLQHAGQPEPQSLSKIASGGELSRVGLAIAAVAAQGTACTTLLFDEVDAGIGGNTGHVVGRLLRSLGASHQVLAVTHLPQVAARAHHHARVSKNTDALPALSTVVQLGPEERVEEIARMLGDEGLKAPSIQLARELLSLNT